jgi:CheY-like chemotaxis protein
VGKPGSSVVNISDRRRDVAQFLRREDGTLSPKILLVDDNQTNLVVTRGALEGAGYTVECLSDGSQAWSRITTHGYALAILDMHMPGCDGPQIISRYRANKPDGGMPIIILTADGRFNAQQTCASAGADVFLVKPILPEVLVGEVRRLIASYQYGELDPTSDEVDDPDCLSWCDPKPLDNLDHHSVRQIISLSKQDCDRALQQLVEACDSSNHLAFLDAVMSIKSVASVIGGVRLSYQCTIALNTHLQEFLKERHTWGERMHSACTDTFDHLDKRFSE